MSIKPWFCAFLMLTIFGGICYAAIYQKQEANGDITYSDTPSPDANPVSLPNVNVAAPGPSTFTTTNGKKTAKASPYSVFTIKSPKDQETIQNQPMIPVNINIEPELQDGDHIQLFLDGAAASNPTTSTHFELNTVVRGTHQLYAVLIDANQQIQRKTPTITIFIHRNSVNTSPASARPAAAP